MVAENKILTAEQEAQLRQPIDETVGAIQAKINELRADGTDKVIDIQNSLDSLKRDKIYTAQEKEVKAQELRTALEQAKAVEAKNKDAITKLIAQAESYLKDNYQGYYQAVAESCKLEKAQAEENYRQSVAALEKEHQATVAKLTDAAADATVGVGRADDPEQATAKDLSVYEKQIQINKNLYH